MLVSKSPLSRCQGILAIPRVRRAQRGRGRLQEAAGRAHFVVWQTISFAPYPHTTRASPWCSQKLSFGP